MPTPALSLAAAAAAAEAYFKGSPAGFAGGGAGFIVVAGIVVLAVGNVAIVASAGKGDFIAAIEGRRAVTTGASGMDFSFATFATSATGIFSGISSKAV